MDDRLMQARSANGPEFFIDAAMISLGAMEAEERQNLCKTRI
jgi:hypothetical protein